MSLSHFRNSHAAVNKWEVVSPALFEVTLLPPALDGQQDALTTQLLLEHVISIDGLDGLNPQVGTIVQKYKQSDRTYAGMPESTHLELTMTFTLNLNDANENYVYTTFRKWKDKSYNPATGAYGLKKDYCGAGVIVEHNRDGGVWRNVTCVNLYVTNIAGLGTNNYNSGNEAKELTVSFIADCWDDKTVGLPIYE